MKQKNRKHKKSREEALASLYNKRLVLANLDLGMYKEAMRLERERRKNREFHVI